MRTARTIFSPIPKLDGRRRPSAIRFAVIAIVIDAIKRVFCRWAHSYVCGESLEGIPLGAYLDAASTPQVKVLRTRTQTPAAHARPRLIERMCFFSVHSAPVSMSGTRSSALGNKFEIQTSATIHPRRLEIAPCGVVYDSAVAPTDDTGVRRTMRREINHDKPSVSCAHNGLRAKFSYFSHRPDNTDIHCNSTGIPVKEAAI